MLSVSYAGKNAYSAGQTSGVLRDGASGAKGSMKIEKCPKKWEKSKRGGGSAPEIKM